MYAKEVKEELSLLLLYLCLYKSSYETYKIFEQ